MDSPIVSWLDSTKYYVVGSDKLIVMGPTASKHLAEDHAAAMNRTNSIDDNRHWRVIERKSYEPLLKVGEYID